MESSTLVIGSSVLTALAIALMWLNAPLVPALAGGAGAGMLLYLRSRRRAH